MCSPSIDRSGGSLVGFEEFLRSSFPTLTDFFTTEAAIRALATYWRVSEWEASELVDARQSRHTLEQMRMYAGRLMETMGCDLSEERCRMTVMLPTSHGGAHIEKTTWGNNDNPSPSPVEPSLERRKKICKQFREKGTCKFGSRCLYHHSNSLHIRQADPYIARTQVASSLGIIDRCKEQLRRLNVSDESSKLITKREVREFLGALPSSTNNYRPPEKSINKAMCLPHSPPLTGEVAHVASTTIDGVVMVPLLLPNGSLYGYAPLPLRAQPLQTYPC